MCNPVQALLTVERWEDAPQPKPFDSVDGKDAVRAPGHSFFRITLKTNRKFSDFSEAAQAQILQVLCDFLEDRSR